MKKLQTVVTYVVSVGNCVNANIVQAGKKKTIFEQRKECFIFERIQS